MSSSYGTSTSQGTSSSTSTPSVAPVNLDIAAMLKQLSGAAMSMSNDTYQWAQQQFAKSSQVTDQMVRDAATYSSQPRIAAEMGKAETDTGQAMEAGRVNAEQQLQSFGIDPSSGRYQALERAQQSQKAAAQAGAGQVARQRTEDTGRQLRAQAINAEFANQNTGAAMRGVAGQFANTAVAAGKYAPTAQNTQSQSQQRSQSSNVSKNPSQQSRQGSGTGMDTGSGSRSPVFSSGSNQGGNQGGGQSGGGQGGGYNYNRNAGIMNVPDQGDGITDYSQMGDDIYSGGNVDPFASQYGGYNTGGDQYNPGADNMGGIYDPSAGYNSYDQGGGWQTQASGDQSSGYDTSNTNWGGGDYYSQGGGGYYDDAGYAKGGPVPPDQTTGGQVPTSASPSQGIQTDDVPANLNEGEFVVPRDVAKWKGEEFFQKLIAQSRKARVMAPGKGKPGPAMQGAPRFASQAMGA